MREKGIKKREREKKIEKWRKRERERERTREPVRWLEQEVTKKIAMKTWRNSHRYG